MQLLARTGWMPLRTDCTDVNDITHISQLKMWQSQLLQIYKRPHISDRKLDHICGLPLISSSIYSQNMDLNTFPLLVGRNKLRSLTRLVCIWNFVWVCSLLQFFSALRNHYSCQLTIEEQQKEIFMAPLELLTYSDHGEQCDWNEGYSNMQQCSSKDATPRSHSPYIMTAVDLWLIQRCVIRLRYACWIDMFWVQRSQCALSDINQHNNGYESNVPSCNWGFIRLVNYVWENDYPNRL